MPIFSFLVADIHAHVWGMLTALGAFHCVFNVARYNGEIKCDKSLPLGVGIRARYVLHGEFMGCGYPRSARGIFVVAKYRHDSRTHIIIATAYLRTAYIVALPWSVTNHLPIQGSD